MKPGKMTKGRLASVWAILAAPLVGAPLMVALLTLPSGASVEPAAEPEVGAALEQVESRELEELTARG
ncbi:MAG TPA: hypothetical protein VLA09_06525 [Longimicrobiales bacterium]|nr:hypothetical protein [Longimicrobiales bacterium]